MNTRKKIGSAILALLVAVLSFGFVPGPLDAGATQNDYVTVAWKVPLTSTEWNEAGKPTGNALDGIIWPQKFELAAVTQGADVDALDATLTECGVYQIDVYPNGQAAQDLIDAKTLDWGDDHGLVQEWDFIDNGDCTKPDPKPREVTNDHLDCETRKVVTTKDTFETSYVLMGGEWVLGTEEVQTGTDIFVSERDATNAELTEVPCEELSCPAEFPSVRSTNILPNGWTVGAGDVEYVDGGIKLSVPGEWAETYIERDVNLPFGQVADGLNFTATSVPFVGLHLVTDQGVIVYEQEPSYGGNLWSTSDFGVGAGLGYASFASAEEFLNANPELQVTSIRLLYTNSVEASTIVTLAEFGCAEFTFDHETTPSNPQWWVSQSCEPFIGTAPQVQVHLENPYESDAQEDAIFLLDGKEYVIAYGDKEVVTFNFAEDENGGTVEIPLSVNGEVQEPIIAITDCEDEPPVTTTTTTVVPPVDTPVTPQASSTSAERLAETGSNTGLNLTIGGLLVAFGIGAVAVSKRRRTA